MNIERNLRWAGFLLALAAVASAQNYQVKWSVVDIGGGLMASANYRTLVSLGQTATGHMASSSYQSDIGYWQADTFHVGVYEEAHWHVAQPLTTSLGLPYPDPSPLSRGPMIRYSVAEESRVRVRVFDLTGRIARTLVDDRKMPGRYATRLTDNGTPNSVRLSAGVYFVRMTAGNYQATRKFILQ
jgi:hypothetical protein